MRRAITGFVLLAACLTFPASSFAEEVKATFYVATNGNDGWSGKLAAPNGGKTDGPFATLGRARDAVRELKGKTAPKEPFTVVVRGGKYFLDQTLGFGPEDSGSREAPITYQAYAGEEPILSGGRKVTGWERYKGQILQAKIPGAKGGKWKSRQLFYNGQRQIRARYPNLDPQNPLYGGWAFIEGPTEKESIISFIYKPGTFPRHWVKPTEAEVFAFPDGGWANDIVPIKTIDEGKRIITLVRGVRNPERDPWWVRGEFKAGDRFRIENLLDELDQPGEWCLDSEDGIVYFWPPSGSINSADEIVVPALDTLVDINRASWLVISGFTFTETSGGDDMHRDSLDGYGPMYPNQGWKYCGEAVHLKDAEYCVIDRNHFDAVGGNAVYLEGYNLRNVIRRNEISYAGANGICLLGNYLRNLVPSYVPDEAVLKLPWLQRKQRLPMFNEVVDNYIHHCGVINKYVAGVFLGVSDGTLVAHNRIEYVPHHAINLGMNGFGRNIVEYNEIHFVSLETGDNGAINAWMDNETSNVRAGHIIRFNLITDSEGCHTDREGKIVRRYGWANGIYLDNYSSNCFVYGNIILRVSGFGVFLQSGTNNVVENNIIVDAASGQIAYTYGYNPISGLATGHRFCRNIAYFSNPKASLFLLYKWSDYMIAKSDGNVYFNAAGGDYTVEKAPVSVETNFKVGNEFSTKFSFTDWQKMGYDRDSTVADPLFVDVLHGDYRLKPDSPAIRLGFVPIDISKIGIQHRD